MVELVWVSLVVAGCLALSFVFSGAEVALFSPWEGARGMAARLRKRPYALLATILLANTLANSLGAAVFVSYLQELPALPEWAVSVSEVILFTGLLLVVSEITPKTLALKRPRGFASWSAWVLVPFHILFYPISAITELLMRSRRGPGRDFLDLRDLRRAGRLIDPSAVDWHVFEDAVGLFVGAVRGVATPRNRIKWARLDMRVSEIKALVKKTGHSRFPVMGDGPDDIRGYIWCVDLMGLPDSSPIKPYLRETLFILESTKLVDAFGIMARAGEGFAVLVDEFGGTVGLVTARDLAGHLLGGLGFSVKRTGKGRFILSGNVDVGTLERLTSTDIGPPEEDLAGLLTRLLGRVPEEGDEVEVGGLRITVLEKRGEDVQSVKVEVLRT